MERRLYWHVTMLNAGRHHCRHLQNAWAKYGRSGFRLRRLETCRADDLQLCEQKWMDRNAGRLFNSQPLARTSRGYRLSDETKAKLSTAAKRRAADPAERAIRSERAKAMHAAGRIPTRNRVPIRPKTCNGCGLEFVPVRLPSGLPSATKWCDDCRPPHKGGYYKTAEHW
jgi:hypothetical protein